MGRVVVLLVLAVSAPAVGAGCRLSSASSPLPAGLTDEEFWNLSSELSEPPGEFTHSDNLVSNERFYAHTIRLLRARGGVYIGVGPEQNFSYIARLEPAMAFIVDIREENRQLHLLYKALFGLSSDRVSFVSRLFSREQPIGLDAGASARELFNAYATATPSAHLRDATARAVRAHLLDDHRLPLSEDDLASIDRMLGAFHQDGPGIHYGRLRPDSPPGPSYRVLMTARDVAGQARSYLASDEAFAFVKDLQAKNLIVPVVGDFGGKAVDRIADHIRQLGGVVSALYASNVEVYLNAQQRFRFCEALETLPSALGTWFIGSRGLQPIRAKLRKCSPWQRPASRP